MSGYLCAPSASHRENSELRRDPPHRQLLTADIKEKTQPLNRQTSRRRLRKQIPTLFINTSKRLSCLSSRLYSFLPLIV